MNTYPHPVWGCPVPPVSTRQWSAEDWIRYAGPRPDDYFGGQFDGGAWRWYCYAKNRQHVIDWLAREFPTLFNQEVSWTPDA